MRFFGCDVFLAKGYAVPTAEIERLQANYFGLYPITDRVQWTGGSFCLCGFFARVLMCLAMVLGGRGVEKGRSKAHGDSDR